MKKIVHLDAYRPGGVPIAPRPTPTLFAAVVPKEDYVGDCEDHGDFYPVHVDHYAASPPEEMDEPEHVFIHQTDEQDNEATIRVTMKQAEQLRDALIQLFEVRNKTLS